MGFKDVLGTISPAYGLATGEGMIGKLFHGKKAVPVMDNKNNGQKARQEEIIANEKAKALKVRGFKKGAYPVGGSHARDGRALRGRTKG